ncbi:hypothetical protein E2C01_053355 [Portunus trituberculatus]|uniref:Uncharacterized protein n=1 Tax=Portunus trituberculatus TaxID=210409 RepID=A0A5B7GQ37_PORTR|nr:hypothetical protein [Portunus trituberculatus]
MAGLEDDRVKLSAIIPDDDDVEVEDDDVLDPDYDMSALLDDTNDDKEGEEVPLTSRKKKKKAVRPVELPDKEEEEEEQAPTFNKTWMWWEKKDITQPLPEYGHEKPHLIKQPHEYHDQDEGHGEEVNSQGNLGLLFI